jgi:hypothetical protein
MWSLQSLGLLIDTTLVAVAFGGSVAMAAVPNRATTVAAQRVGTAAASGVWCWHNTRNTARSPPLYYAAIEELAGVSSEGWPIKWLSETGFGPVTASLRDWIWDSTYDRVTFRCGEVLASFTRGMLASSNMLQEGSP